MDTLPKQWILPGIKSVATKHSKSPPLLPLVRLLPQYMYHNKHVKLYVQCMSVFSEVENNITLLTVFIVIITGHVCWYCTH